MAETKYINVKTIIPTKTHKRLKKLCEENGITIKEFIAEAIEAELEAYEY